MVVGILGLMALVIFLGVFGEFVFAKTRIPDALWLIAIGIVAGPLLGLVSQQQLWVFAPFFSAVALAVIMFEGGLHLNIYDVIKHAPTSLLLGFAGFFLNVAVITLVLEGLALLGFLSNWSTLNSILLGAILGGSSSLVVLPLVRASKLNRRVSSILTLESSITDVLAVVITIALVQSFLSPESGIQGALHTIASSFSIGAMLGIVVGVIWLYILKFFKNKEGLYHHNYMLTFACLLGLYAFTEFVGGSGAIAGLIFGIILGNAQELQKMLKLSRRISLDRRVREFNSQVSFFVKTFFFALIGLLFFVSFKLLLVSLTVVAAIAIARPVGVKFGTFREKLSAKDKSVINGLIPRGLAAAVLAILPSSMGIPGTENFAGIVFTAIIATIAITTAIFYARTR